MKYLTEFRNGEIARKLAREIAQITTRPWKIMEVCGGQTHSIIKNGIDQMLPPGIEMIHGPGCPVCVTPLELIDKALAIASQPGVIFCSFGDMLRVPGTDSDLFQVKGRGGDVRVVYSPLDAVDLAVKNPDKQVVFFGVGFETTAPANAMSVHLAKRRGLTNFSLLVSHVLVPPAISAIMSSPGNQVQAFLAAGHVCSVMGYWQYPPLAEKFGVPIVVTGFEPLDLLEGIRRAVAQLESPAATKSKTPTAASSHSTVIKPRKNSCLKSSKSPIAPGAASASFPKAAGGSAPAIATSTPKSASTSPAFTPRNRRSAVPATFCAEPSSPPSAQPSAKNAPLATRSARRWSRAKAPAPPITTTAASSPPKISPVPGKVASNVAHTASKSRVPSF